MISYLLPTRNRPRVLEATLAALGGLPDHAGRAEVILVDNASEPPVRAPARLSNGVPVKVVRRETNSGAAARNRGARAARGAWLVMLDDDSHPQDTGHLRVIEEAPKDVAAIGAEITLPDGSREAGGLPEVFVGCGAAVRRRAFLDAGGYDPGFGFYAEEYDLCAKLLLAGWRVEHDGRFRVLHRKVAEGRDMDVILHNLVRNNGWVMQRYAPPLRRPQALSEAVARYGRIAIKEQATRGYAEGVAELLRTRLQQRCSPMSDELFDRFIGLSHAREALRLHPELGPGVRAAVVDEGKNASVVLQVLHELGVTVVTDEAAADVHVIGTLSPGPMLDAFERRACGVICPWRPVRGMVPTGPAGP